MQHNQLRSYLDEAESALQTLKACHFEKYEEEILTPERANLRVRIRFATGHLLELNEAITTAEGDLQHLSYRYHLQDRHNSLVFRYDNTPHFPSLDNFPNHKHLLSRVTASLRPTFREVVEEVNQYLAASK